MVSNIVLPSLAPNGSRLSSDLPIVEQSLTEEGLVQWSMLPASLNLDHIVVEHEEYLVSRINKCTPCSLLLGPFYIYYW